MSPEFEAALRAVAAQFAASREDLERIAATLERTSVPRVEEFLPQVRLMLTGRTLETYRHHLDTLIAAIGSKHLDEISLLDLEQLAVRVRQTALDRQQSLHGFGAQESFVNATRFAFNCAVKAGHLRENPAARLERPRRRRSTRRALSGDELSAIFDATLHTSRDPELDLLILAFARETACRREGIINLTVDDLHPAPSARLYEKFDERREVPLSIELDEALRTHAMKRGGAAGSVFRYRNGDPVTDRRFDTLFQRIGDHLPWVRSLGISLHWIRYTTLTDVRIASGERVAAAYAGHSDDAGGVTAIYTRATFDELQAAHHLLFG